MGHLANPIYKDLASKIFYARFYSPDNKRLMLSLNTSDQLAAMGMIVAKISGAKSINGK
jgi:hypothetical protein